MLMLENGSAGDEEEEEAALARELDAALGTNDLASLQQVISSAPPRSNDGRRGLCTLAWPGRLFLTKCCMTQATSQTSCAI